MPEGKSWGKFCHRKGVNNGEFSIRKTETQIEIQDEILKCHDLILEVKLRVKFRKCSFYLKNGFVGIVDFVGNFHQLKIVILPKMSIWAKNVV